MSSTEISDQFIRSLFLSLVLTTTSSRSDKRGLPCFTSWSDECPENAAKILHDVYDFVESGGGQVNLPDDLLDPSLYAHVVHVIDKMLETADPYLEHVTNNGTKFTKSVLQLSLAVDKERLLNANVTQIDKPILGDIDNSRERPFRPRIIHKPHQLVPLNLIECRSAASTEASDVIAPITYFQHVYEAELKNLKYPAWELEDPFHAGIESAVPNLAGRPFLLVETVDQLDMMLEEIRSSGAREIALDLENHSYRSYQGFACLVQISTRAKDYVIDALVLRPCMSKLGDLLADPITVKILHDSENGNMWLQRDFGLYLVNVFDTYHAAKALKFPALSLAHLLTYYANIRLNKKHQLSDWRQRPLPADMIAYARSDTVYMHYLHDRMRRDLWKAHGREGVESVLNASRKWCMRRYEKEPFWPLGYRKLLNSEGVPPIGGIPTLVIGSGSNSNDSRNNSSSISGYSSSEPCLTKEQDMVMAALWSWRDLTAREEDESPAFVMSNAELIRIGQRLPRTLQHLEDCGPLSGLVRQRAAEVLDMVSSKLEVRRADSPVGAASTPSSSSRPNANVAFDTPSKAASGAGDNSARLYGRSLQTPSRELTDGVEGDAEAVSAAGTGGAVEHGSTRPAVYTFLPAVMGVGGAQAMPASAAPGEVGGGSASPFLVAGSGGAGPGTGRDNKPLPSPVMNADDIFRLAGWSSPAPGAAPGVAVGMVTAGRVANSPSPFSWRKGPAELPPGAKGGVGGEQTLSGTASGEDTGAQEENLQQQPGGAIHGVLWRGGDATTSHGDEAVDPSDIDISAEKVVKVEKDLTCQFRDASSSQGSGAVLGEGEGKRDSGVDEKSDDDEYDDELGLESLPGSYEEIYEISNRNRKRNKEKKRQRDGDDGDESEVTQAAALTKGTKPAAPVSAAAAEKGPVAAAVRSSSSSSAPTSSHDKEMKRMGARLFDENIYFSHASESAAADMEGTLDFAEAIGWMARCDRQAIKEAHHDEQMAHADSHQGEAGGDGHHGHSHAHGHHREGSGGSFGTGSRDPHGHSKGDRDRVDTSSLVSSSSSGIVLANGMPRIKGGSDTPPRRGGGNHGGGMGGGVGGGGGRPPHIQSSSMPGPGGGAHRLPVNKSFDFSRMPQGQGMAMSNAFSGAAVGNSYDSTSSLGSAGSIGSVGGVMGRQHAGGRGVLQSQSQSLLQSQPQSQPQSQYNAYAHPTAQQGERRGGGGGSNR